MTFKIKPSLPVPNTGKRRRHNAHAAKHGTHHRNFERTVTFLRALAHILSHNE